MSAFRRFSYSTHNPSSFAVVGLRVGETLVEEDEDTVSISTTITKKSPGGGGSVTRKSIRSASLPTSVPRHDKAFSDMYDKYEVNLFGRNIPGMFQEWEYSHSGVPGMFPIRSDHVTLDWEYILISSLFFV